MITSPKAGSQNDMPFDEVLCWKRRNKILAIISLLCVLGLASALTIDQHATRETKNLYRHMKALAKDQNKVMFGHQEDTWYGGSGGHAPYTVVNHDGHFKGFKFTIDQVNSNSPDELSDTRSVTGQYPAVLGLDFSGLTDDRIKIIKYLGKKAHARGQIITLSWHMWHNPVTGGDPWMRNDNGSVYHIIKRILPGGDYNWKYNQMLDKIVNFAFTFKDDNGNQIPFIMRFFHEQNGNWFWWGLNNKAQNSPQDLKDIFKYSVNYIKNTKNVHNILYAISPDKYTLNSKDDYLAVYPGDDYVDIMGLDFYYDQPNSPSASDFKKTVGMVVDLAESRGKIPALTEMGMQHNGINTDLDLWNDHVLDLMKEDRKCARIAFMLTWATLCNDGQCQTWMPWKGHPAEANFRKFYNDPMTYFANNIQGFYN